MKENFLHFLSHTPSQIEINGTNIGLIDNISCMELDIITKTNHLFITYKPISENISAIPYTVKINSSNIPNCDNEHIKIIPFPNNNYDIIMKPFYYYQVSENNVLFNSSIDKYFVSVITDTLTNVTIYSGSSTMFHAKLPLFKAVKVELKKELIIVQGLIDENTYYLLIIDTNNFSTIHSDISHSIEIDDTYLSTLKKMETICHHAEVVKVQIATKSKEKFYVLENEQDKTINNYIIPLAFLQCIQVGDIENAKKFISNNYSNTTIQQFQEYFGNISEIYLNRHDLVPQYFNYTVKSNNWKNYNFIMDKNIILDIQEIL